ncbi:MAG: hypothetical protein KGN00_07385 [Chloroflexota bacterium]|nr:hypothetical protein [Chloroflexota bacterium]MDE3193491.1 hypothetical protein [Chloroflexota bacterium]
MTARLPGTADEIRARVAGVLESYVEARDTVLRRGIVDAQLKDLCFRHLAGESADLTRCSQRERAALEWADAIAYDSALATDELWSRLHDLFSEPELVELGCAVGFELGYQHWRRSLGLTARD